MQCQVILTSINLLHIESAGIKFGILFVLYIVYKSYPAIAF